jgi:bidirectional [NiFe] hydrogenase diaphorase subunit
MPTITINGQSVKTKKANTILEVAKQEGIGIPTLCHHEKLSNLGACRLCQVEVVSGQRSRLVASCTFPIEEGMVVVTNSKRVFSARKILLELLMARCPDSVKIREMAGYLGVHKSRFIQKDKDCILCGLCVRLCNERIGSNAVGFNNRGPTREVGTPFDRSSKPCYECRACTGICPVDCIRYEETENKRINWKTKLDENQRPDRDKATVDLVLCNGCGDCVSVCPVECISLKDYSENDHQNKIAVVDQNQCVRCRYCERICIKQAIVLPDKQAYAEV